MTNQAEEFIGWIEHSVKTLDSSMDYIDSPEEFVKALEQVSTIDLLISDLNLLREKQVDRIEKSARFWRMMVKIRDLNGSIHAKLASIFQEGS